MKLSAFDWVEARELMAAGATLFLIGLFIGSAITTCAFIYFI